MEVATAAATAVATAVEPMRMPESALAGAAARSTRGAEAVCSETAKRGPRRSSHKGHRHQPGSGGRAYRSRASHRRVKCWHPVLKCWHRAASSPRWRPKTERKGARVQMAALLEREWAEWAVMMAATVNVPPEPPTLQLCRSVGWRSQRRRERARRAMAHAARTTRHGLEQASSSWQQHVATSQRRHPRTRCNATQGREVTKVEGEPWRRALVMKAMAVVPSEPPTRRRHRSKHCGRVRRSSH